MNDEDLLDDEIEEMNEDEIKLQIPSFDSAKLCELIVAYRYLGLYRTIYISCMEELATRRINGDEFEFEKYIDKSLNELPKIEFNLKDLGGAMDQLRKMTSK